MNNEINCFEKKIEIPDETRLQDLISSLKPNEKWQQELNEYYNIGEVSFDHHKTNCKKISSLKNRIFADFEWNILQNNWDKIKENFHISETDNLDTIQSKYQNVVNIFTQDLWKENKGDKLFSRPFAEINRIFVGFNKESLCPIIYDGATKFLLRGLQDEKYISILDKDILTISQENGGWIVRSALISKIFNITLNGNNRKTLPWICYLFISNKEVIGLLKNNNNIILTGAPGTGKTYSAKQTAELFAGKDHVKKIQFHPSYDYTDLVEGMRPSGSNSFSRVDGSFKRFCKCAILGLPVDVSLDELKNEEAKYIENNKENEEEENESSKEQLPYVFIIDEINRGEVSKIFGEVFFCIEETHRGKDETIDTQYQNLVPENDLFYKGFYVPKNVYVIGTMNDIDRSVESMDFAFRRRFAFYEVTAETSADMLDSMKNVEPAVIEELKKLMTSLNDEIIKPQYGLSTAYQIGGAYFLKYQDYFSSSKDKESSYKALWENHLKGTIFEYFRALPQEERKNCLTKMEKAFLGQYYKDPKDEKSKASKDVQQADADNNDRQ